MQSIAWGEAVGPPHMHVHMIDLKGNHKWDHMNVRGMQFMEKSPTYSSYIV